MKQALEKLDVSESDAAGKWTHPQVTWERVQASAGALLILPSEAHQGNTTLCGAYSLLDAWARFYPLSYAHLVRSVWAGDIVDRLGHPWGGTQGGDEEAPVDQELLKSGPASSVNANSVCQWMLATSILRGKRDRSALRNVLGHDNFLGKDAWGPDGKKTPDFNAGLTMPWEMKSLMETLLRCTDVNRELAYWVSADRIMQWCLQLVPMLITGEVVCMLLISNTMLSKAPDVDGNFKAERDIETLGENPAPEHWVRLHSIKRLGQDTADGGKRVHLQVYNPYLSDLESRYLTEKGFGRIVLEAIFGVFGARTVNDIVKSTSTGGV